MAAPVVAAVTSADNDSIDYVIAVPAGTTNGDLLIGVVASDWGTDVDNAFPTPAWTKLTISSYSAGTNAYHIAMYGKVAASEPASYTVLQDASASVAGILRITGWDSAAGLATAVKQVAPSTTGTGRTAPSIVPAGSDDLLITVHSAEISGSGANTWTPPAGMTEHIDRQSTIWSSLEINSLQNPANPSGTKVATPSINVNTGAACTISIKAPGGSATNLVIQDALHASVADQLGVTQNHLLIINDALHTHTADSANFSQVHQIAVFDAIHTTLADNLVLAGGTTLVIQDATHAHSADGLVLVQAHNIAVQDAIHQTRSDTISLVPPGTGGFMTVSDVQVQKLGVLTGKSGSIQDLQFAYYSGLSGLVPAANFSVADHQRAYWEAQTGLTGKSLADLEKAFYDVQLIAAGTLSDREFTYWTNV